MIATGTKETINIIMNVVYGPRNVAGPVSIPPGKLTFIP
jgi:hypothetical protein